MFLYTLELRGGNHDELTLRLERDAPLLTIAEFTWPCCGQAYRSDEPPTEDKPLVLSYVPPVVPAAFLAAW